MLMKRYRVCRVHTNDGILWGVQERYMLVFWRTLRRGIYNSGFLSFENRDKAEQYLRLMGSASKLAE